MQNAKQEELFEEVEVEDGPEEEGKTPQETNQTVGDTERTTEGEDITADEDLSEKLFSRTALGRWGEPDEIAGAAVFLCSEEAAYVTGQVLTVDGGCASYF